MNRRGNADARILVARPPKEFRPHDGITKAAMIASAIAAHAMLMARYFCCSLIRSSRYVDRMKIGRAGAPLRKLVREVTIPRRRTPALRFSLCCASRAALPFRYPRRA